jgi:hypothetical protein
MVLMLLRVLRRMFGRALLFFGRGLGLRSWRSVLRFAAGLNRRRLARRRCVLLRDRTLGRRRVIRRAVFLLARRRRLPLWR